jgi:hypothetical protein
MECSCTARSIDEDGYYSDRTRRAEKQTTCPECGAIIEKGEEYLFSTLFMDGRIYNSKMCKNCESITKQFFSDGWMIGSIISDLESYLDAVWLNDLPSSCISKLSPKAKDLVCDILQNFQE